MPPCRFFFAALFSSSVSRAHAAKELLVGGSELKHLCVFAAFNHQQLPTTQSWSCQVLLCLSILLSISQRLLELLPDVQGCFCYIQNSERTCLNFARKAVLSIVCCRGSWKFWLWGCLSVNFTVQDLQFWFTGEQRITVTHLPKLAIVNHFFFSVWVMWACFCYWVAQVVATPTLGYGFIKESIGLLSSIDSAGYFSRKTSCWSCCCPLLVIKLRVRPREVNCHTLSLPAKFAYAENGPITLWIVMFADQ